MWWGFIFFFCIFLEQVFVQTSQFLKVKQGRGGKSRPTKAGFAKISSNLESQQHFRGSFMRAVKFGFVFDFKGKLDQGSN